MIVKLTPREIMLGATMGVMRHIQDLRDRRAGVNQQPAHLAWQVKIEGALAELAVAKALGDYWSGASYRGAADSGGIEVRMTRYQDGCLFLHEHDKSDARYVLAAGLNGTYKVAGWLWGREGQQEKYWRRVSAERNPAFFVPQSELHPLDEIGGVNG